MVSSPKGLLEVHFPKHVIESNAEKHYILKPTHNGEQAFFNVIGRDSFIDVDSDDFFAPFEIALIQYDILNSITVGCL